MVAAAIDVGNSKFFKDAGINGYEFVDKIVQMPFGVPRKIIVLFLLASNPCDDSSFYL